MDASDGQVLLSPLSLHQCATFRIAMRAQHHTVGGRVPRTQGFQKASLASSLPS